MSDDALAEAAPHLAPATVAAPVAPARAGAGRPWRPKRVLITASAARWPLAAEVAARVGRLGAEVTWLKGDRLPSLKGAGAAEGYRLAKSTLAVVVAPPSKRRLQPIPPSADWRFDLAEGCPAHCQYCYLAGSLQGAPVTRLYANLPETLDGLEDYVGRGRVTSTDARRAGEGTTFEASCYTDPLGIEHLSGALAETIRRFGAWEADVGLRFTTKFADVDALLGLAHGRKTRARFSVNAEAVVRRFEGGTAPLDARIDAMRRMAGAGYPVGLTVAPIMPIEGWARRLRRPPGAGGGGAENRAGRRPQRRTYHPPFHADLEGGAERLVPGERPGDGRAGKGAKADQVRRREVGLPEGGDGRDARVLRPRGAGAFAGGAVACIGREGTLRVALAARAFFFFFATLAGAGLNAGASS